MKSTVQKVETKLSYRIIKHYKIVLTTHFAIFLVSERGAQVGSKTSLFNLIIRPILRKRKSTNCQKSGMYCHSQIHNIHQCERLQSSELYLLLLRREHVRMRVRKLLGTHF